MPDDFERFIYPDLDFAVPSDPERYRARLVERFPEEAAAHPLLLSRSPRHRSLVHTLSAFRSS